MRSTLSEVLPFETPPIVSNRGFYEFLREFGIRITNDEVSWQSGSEAVARLMLMLAGKSENDSRVTAPGGREFARFKRAPSIPFEFRIGRQSRKVRHLAIPHPFSQILIAEFYERNKSLILHYTKRSSFSMRHPSRTSRYTVTKDALHERLRTALGQGIESNRHEYKNFKSYFAYEKYSNIYKFFESSDLQFLEKRFALLMRLDVARCFDSIYTHSISWATSSREHVKRNIEPAKNRPPFADEFDKLLQQMNHGETNGILVGPEVSRIFAEVILQSCDQSVRRRLDSAGLIQGRHYDVLRYVDDYFIFTDRVEDGEKIRSVIQEELLFYKLHLNEVKSSTTATPDITPISIAKSGISRLLDKSLKFAVGPTTEEPASDAPRTPKFAPSPARSDPRLTVASKTTSGDSADAEAVSHALMVSGQQLITRYKTILKETGVDPADVINYTLVVVEAKLVDLLTTFARGTQTQQSAEYLTASLVGILDFSFYAHSASPLVTPTVKLTRICNHAIKMARSSILSFSQRQRLYEAVYHDIIGVLDRSRSTENSMVENLYLLPLLGELGRRYRLTSAALCDYFGIHEGPDNQFAFPSSFDHFAICSLLHYIESRDQYEDLRTCLIKHGIDRIFGLPPRHAERALLVLDLTACPYVPRDVKMRFLQGVGFKRRDHREEIIDLRSHWFVKWRNFDLGGELDAKRHQEVY